MHLDLYTMVKNIQEEHAKIGYEVSFVKASKVLADDYRNLQEKTLRGIALTRFGKI